MRRPTTSSTTIAIRLYSRCCSIWLEEPQHLDLPRKFSRRPTPLFLECNQSSGLCSRKRDSIEMMYKCQRYP